MPDEKKLPGTEDQPDETPQDAEEHIDGDAIDYTAGPYTKDEDLPPAQGGVEQ